MLIFYGIDNTMSIFQKKIGDFPENLHCVVFVIISKHSFESFMCLERTIEESKLRKKADPCGIIRVCLLFITLFIVMYCVYIIIVI